MIRWSLQHGFICIPKTNKEQRMAENRDVFDFEISSEDMQVLVSMKSCKYIAFFSYLLFRHTGILCKPSKRCY